MFDLDYDQFKGQYFTFIYQTPVCTWGEPHPKTGRYSIFGEFLGPFSSKKEAEEAGDREVMRNNRPSKAEVVTARQGRKYRLGVSVKTYLEELHTL